METLALKDVLDLQPRVMSRQDTVKTVAERYREQYPTDREVCGGLSTGAVAQKLDNLPPDATPEDVAAIIGNDSWTVLECDVCEMNREAVVSIPRKWSSPIMVCHPCARGILELFVGAENG